MKEQIVSIEVAKMAKEIGFNWGTTSHYKGEKLINNGVPYNLNNKRVQRKWKIEMTSAPTQSLLQKYYREKHNILVNIVPVGNNNNELKYYYYTIYGVDTKGGVHNINRFLTYEKALEEGLRKCGEYILTQQVQIKQNN